MSAPGLACQAYLKKTRVKLELVTDYDMILMIEKGLRGGIHQYWTKKKCEKWIWKKKLFKLMNNSGFGKSYGKCEK